MSAPGSACRARWSPLTSYVATRPPSRKAEAAVTASVTRPPELPRRSRTIPAPLGASATVLRTRSPDPLVKAAILISDPVGEPAHRHRVRGQPGPAQLPVPAVRATLQAEPDPGTGLCLVGVAAQEGDHLGHRPAVHVLAVDAAQPVARADTGDCRGRAALDPGHLDPAVPLAPCGQPDARVLAVEGFFELLVLTLGVDGAPAVAAAAHGPFGRLHGGLAVRHRPGRRLRHGVVLGGQGVGPGGGGLADGLVERAGRRARHEDAREDQRQGRPAADAAG